MKKILLPYVLVPAVALILVTVVRAWMEIQSPTSAMTKILSVNVLSLVWMLVMPAVMLKKGVSLMQGLLAALVFFVLHRAAIGAVYAMAWADKWKIDGTNDDVRYVAQTLTDMGKEATPTTVFLMMTFSPIAFGLAFVFVVWTITWMIGFRGKCGFTGGLSVPQDRSD